MYRIWGCIVSLYHLITVDDNLDHLVNIVFVRFLYNKVIIFLYIGENTLRLCKYPGLLKLLPIYFYHVVMGLACISYYCGALTVIFFYPPHDFMKCKETHLFSYCSFYIQAFGE